jgi:oxygen-independent coproporphyrinogen-3 oxidase
VYVHIPFCAARCDYCDFATWTDRSHLIDDYVDACILDVSSRSLPPATSVFFGGGTPSLLSARSLLRILDAVPRTPDAEVTVECNPDSADGRKLAEYRAGGVNRLSFGVQSMRAHVLAALGRTHDPDNVARAVDAARRVGFERINVDLIYGARGERVVDWEATLDAALALDPGHVSAYALTVEPGTPLGMRIAAGECPAPDDDDQAAKYDIADERLHAAGLRWYEVSNWARPGEECRHNLLYWRQGNYAAIGCAAHGHAGGRRWWNVRTPDRYIAAIAARHSPEAGAETLGPAERADEALMLGLRTAEGITLPGIKLPGPPADPSGVVARVLELVDGGLLDRRGSRVVLTPRGRLLANDVVARLLAASDHDRSLGLVAERTPSVGAGTR